MATYFLYNKLFATRRHPVKSVYSKVLDAKMNNWISGQLDLCLCLLNGRYALRLGTGRIVAMW